MLRLKVVWVLLILTLLLMSGFISPMNNTLTPEQIRGKLIYTKGVSPSGNKIIAELSGIEVPATVLTCMGCHGEKGEGNPEGGVIPSNLTWASLTKAYTVQTSNSREHAPYSERTIISAITMGVDPEGNQLNPVMPKYRLSKQDASDLVAYLKVIGLEKTIGISDNQIRIGVITPPGPALEEMRNSIKSVLNAYITELNEAGGIYDRFIQLEIAEFESPSDHLDDIRKFIESNDLFALTSSFFTGSDKELTLLTNQTEIPAIGIISDYPVIDGVDNRFTFYAYPGIPKQLEAMVQECHSYIKAVSEKVIVLYTSDNGVYKELSNGVKNEFSLLGHKDVQTLELTSEWDNILALIAQIRQQGVDHIFYIGPPGSDKLLFQALIALGWYPKVYLPGSFAGPQLFDLPDNFDQQVILAYPIWPESQEQIPLQFYFNLARKYKLPDRYRHIQLTALGSAMLTMEILKKCGRDITREDLIFQLENSYKIRTGLIPEQTFTVNRRIGSDIVFIAGLDLKNKKIDLLNKMSIKL